jgi:PAS domain S-box-containing protein
MSNHDQANILMVDDQPGKLLSYEAILKGLGENLLKARSAREALELLLHNDIAVVLMDVSMPEIDGFEMADMMHQHPRFQKTAIIFISAVHLTDIDRIKGYESGAVDYISVPVVPELLRAKVSVFTELHRKTRQLEQLNLDLERRVEERAGLLRDRAALLELASEAIMVRSLDGTIQFWNAGAETVYGWRRDEVLGKNVHELLQTHCDSLKSMREFLARDGVWHGNLTHVTSTGHTIIVASRQATTADGKAVLEINRDITTQLRAEEALRKTERLAAMGRVAGIIAHEINNPLESITNTFHLLATHPSLDEEARYYTQLGEEEIRRVSHITRQTLGFYRESKAPVMVSLPQLVDDILELQSRRLEFGNIELNKQYVHKGVIQGFPVELKQVFLNLIGNAVQAMPEGGRLRLRIAGCQSGATGGISVSIVDTGSGITPEQAQHLFEPFFTTKSTKGTGLGLWISKGIVQKYGGTIRFRSVRHADGNITCFRVFFPDPHYMTYVEPFNLETRANLAEPARSSNGHK